VISLNVVLPLVELVIVIAIVSALTALVLVAGGKMFSSKQEVIASPISFASPHDVSGYIKVTSVEEVVIVHVSPHAVFLFKKINNERPLYNLVYRVGNWIFDDCFYSCKDLNE
jgi:hypothetical protein